jgi:tetratricopeptide (TPR) repeat protein
MGGESIGRGQYFCLCLALLSALTGCAAVRDWQERQDIRESLHQGQSLLMRADYDASIKEYQKVVSLAGDRSPSDAALLNIGVIYVHPLNPNRDLQKALSYFSQVIAEYPASPLWQQAQAWIGVLDEAKKSQQEIDNSKQVLDRSKQELEKSKQELEKSKQAIEKSKSELEKSRQEIEKSKQVIEKSRQVDIEIEQKKRDRGR